MDVRETILKRIKDLRKGEVGSPFAFFSLKSFFSSDFFLILLSHSLGAHLLWPQRQAGGEAVRLPDGRHGG